jgi:hypothetical protein
MTPPYEPRGDVNYQLGAVRATLESIQETQRERAITAGITEGKINQLQMSVQQTLSEMATLRGEVAELKAPVHDLVSLRQRIVAILMAGATFGSTITAVWYYWGLSALKWFKQ